MKVAIQQLLKKISTYVYGDTTDYSLENRLLLSTLVIGMVICIPGILSTLLFPKTPLPLKIIPIVLICILLVLYYLVRVKKIIDPILFPVSFIALVGISIVWILNGGIDGSNIIISFVVLLLSLVIVPEKKKKYVLILFIASTVGIYLVQLYRPALITPIDSGFSRWADSLTTVLYCAVMVYYIVRFLHKQYTLERVKAEKFALQLQESNAQLSILNSSKDKFFSIIAHDLKSPFSGFLGLTKLILEDYQKLSAEELREFLNNLHDSSTNLYKLLENLLEWSLVQRGAIYFNAELCYVGYIAKQNIDVQTEIAKQKQIELYSTIADNVQINADIPMLNAIIRNLLSNAIKFTPRGGKIEVGMATSGEFEHIKTSHTSKPTPCIYVRDNGIGMSREIVSKLFKIDEKVSRPGTENEPSTGLGLLLCKEFVHKHGGEIWVQSEYGIGSTFYFTLPQLPPPS